MSFASKQTLLNLQDGNLMFGAIAGDVTGSFYEQSPTKSLDFELFRKLSRFTDDSLLMIAVAD